MILRSLRARNFGVLQPGARIAEFSPTITVVHGPNESGKSTLFRALAYALYQRHKTSSEKAQGEIQPLGASVAPEAEVVFEDGGAVWRVRKRWFKGPTAELARLDGDVFRATAEGAEAETALRALLGAPAQERGVAGPEDRGLGEILLVDQGRLRIAEEGFSDATFDRLQSVVRRVATSAEAHGLFKRAAKERDLRLTPTGEAKKGSPQSVAAADVRRLAEEAAALEERRRRGVAAERELADLGAFSDADAAARVATAEADRRRAQEDAAKAETLDARRLAAEERAARARDDAEARRKALQDRAASEAALAEARARLALAEPVVAAIETEFAAANAALKEAEAALARAEEIRAAAADAVEAAAEAAKFVAARAQLAELARKLAAVEALDRDVAEKSAALAARARPTPTEAAEGRRLRADLEAAAKDLAAFALRVRVTAQRALRVEDAAGAADLAAGDSRDVVGDLPVAFVIPGTAAFVVEGPAPAERTRAAAAERAARRSFSAWAARFGTDDVEEAQRLADERVRIEAEIAAARRERSHHVRDDAEVDALRRRRAEAEALVAATEASRPAWRAAPPDDVAAARLGTEADAERRRAAAEVDRSAKAVAAARARVEGQRSTLAAAAEARSKAREELAAAEGRRAQATKATGADLPTAEARAAEKEAEAASAAAEAEALGRERDLLGDPRAAVERCERVVAELRDEKDRAASRRTRLETELELLRGEGLHERLAKVEAERAEAEARLAAATLDAEAADRLVRALAEAQERAVAAATGPVADRVRRMYSATAGVEATPRYGARFAPAATASGGREIPAELLSEGAQDQLALLTRLALGEIYAKAHGRHAFVLDDPLVNCDRRRRANLLDILVRAARDLQIVVFTCHPEHYEGLPAGAAKVSMAEAVAAAAE